MSMTALASEKVAVVGGIDPDAYAANTYASGWIALANFHQFMAIVQAGTLGSSATLDAKIVLGTDASGTSPLDLSGAAITQLTQAGTDSDKQAIIAFNTSAVPVGYSHFSLSLTIGEATSDAGAIVLGLVPAYGPASGNDAATVDEIVSLP